jgi:hypothetical protein
MNNNLIVEDINRISSIFNNINIPTKSKDLVLENLLLLEAGGPQPLIKQVGNEIEKYFEDGNVRKIVDKTVSKVKTISKSLTLEKRLELWLDQALKTAKGRVQVENLIKLVSNESPEYTEYFVKKYKDIFERMERKSGIEKTLQLLEKNFGSAISKEYARISQAGSLRKLIKNINLSTTRAQTLTRFEKYMASDPYFVGGLKEIVQIFLKDAKRREVGVEKYIEEMFSKIKTLSKITDNYGNLQHLPEAQEIANDVNAMIRGLTSKSMINFDTIYSDIFSKMTESGIDSKHAKMIVDELKNTNPFKYDYYVSPSKKKIWKFLDETTGMDVWRYLRNSEKKFGQKITELVKRISAVGLYGNMKYAKDWRYFIDKYGVKNGKWIAYGYFQIAAKVILPAFIGFWMGLINWAKSAFVNMPEEDKKSLLDQWKEAFTEQYSEVISPPEGLIDKSIWVLQTILPVHMFWDNWIMGVWNGIITPVGGEIKKLWNWISEQLSDTAELDLKQMTPEQCISQYPCLAENGGKVVTTQFGINVWINPNPNALIKEYPLGSYNGKLTIALPTGIESLDCSKFKEKISGPTVLDKISDNEEGFKFWCLKNSKTFVEYNQDTGIGKTDEPMDYQWNGTDFEPF